MIDLEIKNKFVEMCKHIALIEGEFVCLYSSMKYNEEFSNIYSDKNYEILKKKMDNLLFLLNKDNSLINKDAETELWNIV